jgi:Rrf2 family iron-sulfur cluster assembly transcriptional regulator
LTKERYEAITKNLFITSIAFSLGLFLLIVSLFNKRLGFKAKYLNTKSIMFSKTCEYGIRAAIFIASESFQNNRVGLKDIAKKIDSPEAFTAKILQILSKNNIIKSIKGVGGGFEIPKDRMKDIKLSHIVTALEGNSVFTGCGLGLVHCSEEHPCPMHDKFKAIRNELAYMLETTNLGELGSGIKSGDTFLRY